MTTTTDTLATQLRGFAVAIQDDQPYWADKIKAACDDLEAQAEAKPAPAEPVAVPQGPNTEFVLNELRSALNAMLTFFGMDEDEGNKEVFDKARQAYDYAQIVMRPLEPWERQSLADFRACVGSWHEKAVAKGYDGVEELCAAAPAAPAPTVKDSLTPAPAGFVLVPVEPTDAMFRAADKADEAAYVGGSDHGATASDIWAAMLAAAPAAPAQVPAQQLTIDFAPVRDAIANALAQVEALREAPATAPAWQPIETAPPESGLYLVRIGDQTHVAQFNERTATAKWWSAYGMPSRLAQEPTHWMPLPQPPKENPNG